jgi:hypothetical protein
VVPGRGAAGALLTAVSSTLAITTVTLAFAILRRVAWIDRWYGAWAGAVAWAFGLSTIMGIYPGFESAWIVGICSGLLIGSVGLLIHPLRSPEPSANSGAYQPYSRRRISPWR